MKYSISKFLFKWVFPLFIAAVFIACGEATETSVAEQGATGIDASALFVSKCSMCHSFDQNRIGPSLAGVYERWGNDDARLQNFIRNSSKLIAGGDAYAVALYQKWNKANMPAFEALSDEEIKALCEYLKQ